ncbi:sulfatase [Candidatus Woesearchaeota archaeon]|nr:sulfatase [Candidatus Woesearchaeota archaeon]
MNTPPKNVIYISIDCGRRDHFSCYGYPDTTTPNIDRFSKKSTLFRNAFTQAPSTLPSHSTLFTSTYPSVHEAEISTGKALPKTIPTIASILQHAGYATASFNGGAQLDPSWKLDRGFDTYQTGKSLVNNIELAIDWVKDNKSTQFFLFLHGYDVHKRLKLMGPRFLAQFDNAEQAEKERAALNERLKKNPTASEEDKRKYLLLYDDNLELVDTALGHLFTFLDEIDLSENTIIVIFADHGEELGERSSVALHSHTLYDELLRVPLLLKIPGTEQKEIDNPVGLIDVTPTILETLGIDIPQIMQGKSVLPIMAGKETQDRTIFSEFHYPHFEKMCVRTRHHKLIETLHTNYGEAMLKNKAFKGSQYSKIQKIKEFSNRPAYLLANAIYFILKRIGLCSLWIRLFGLFKTYEFYDLKIDPKEETNIYYDDPAKASSHLKLLEKLCKINQQRRDVKDSTPRIVQMSEKLKKRLSELGYIQ